jgi:hypothetical protein
MKKRAVPLKNVLFHCHKNSKLLCFRSNKSDKNFDGKTFFAVVSDTHLFQNI